METRQTSFFVALLNYLHLYYNMSLNLGGYFTYHDVLTIKCLHFVPSKYVLNVLYGYQNSVYLPIRLYVSGFYNCDGVFTARYELSLNTIHANLCQYHLTNASFSYFNYAMSL